MSSFPDDYLDMVDALKARQVEFMLVGGHAVGFHGYTRDTLDFDILIRPTPENVARANDALKDFGSPFTLSESELNSGNWTQIGIKPIRIDLIGKLSGVSTEDLWTHKAAGKIAGRDVFFISYEDLIKNKRASGRNKDLLDVDQLERFRKAQKRG